MKSIRATRVAEWIIIGVSTFLAGCIVDALVNDNVPDQPKHGIFWCNGSTGVYESRDGSTAIPEPFDPACNKVDEP